MPNSNVRQNTLSGRISQAISTGEDGGENLRRWAPFHMAQGRSLWVRKDHPPAGDPDRCGRMVGESGPTELLLQRLVSRLPLRMFCIVSATTDFELIARAAGATV